MSGRALQKSRKLPCLHTSVQYLDKKGLHLIMARVVCLNRGRERCMCVSEERKEVGTRRKEPAVLNSTAPPPTTTWFSLGWPSHHLSTQTSLVAGKGSEFTWPGPWDFRGSSGESFCLHPCQRLSQEPGCLFLQEACCLNAGGTKARASLGIPGSQVLQIAIQM